VEVRVTVNDTSAIAKVNNLPENVRKYLRGAVVELTQALAALVRSKLDGVVLNKISGDLQRSIKSRMVENRNQIYGEVYSDGSVPYASIHEYGGIINHPGSSKFQAFDISGQTIFTHFTRPHTITIPERSYMRSSLADMQEQIVERLTQVAQQAGSTTP
jgi:phage gpG-like protein